MSNVQYNEVISIIQKANKVAMQITGSADCITFDECISLIANRIDNEGASAETSLAVECEDILITMLHGEDSFATQDDIEEFQLIIDAMINKNII